MSGHDAPCPCWTSGASLGHDGHCCFLRDDRHEVPRDQAWRDDADVCHAPERTTP